MGVGRCVITVIAAAYDSPTSYALAADSHGEVNGLRTPMRKLTRFAGNWLAGGAGATAEILAAFDFLAAVEPRAMENEAAVRATLGRLFVYARAAVPRSAEVPGLDSHSLLVGPLGVYVLGNDGGASPLPSRSRPRRVRSDS